MLSSCPACQHKLRVPVMHPAFACPGCHAPLKSNLGRVVFIAILVGIFLETALISIFYIAAGSLLNAFLAWGMFASIPAYLTYWIATRHFLEIQRAS